MAYRASQNSLRVIQELKRKKMQKDGPEAGKSNELSKNFPSTLHNGIVPVQDDGETGDDEGESDDDDADDSDLDEPDAYALSDALPAGNGAMARLTGFSQDDPFTDDHDHVMAGATDDDDYDAVENVSDSDNSEDVDGMKDVRRAAENDLRNEFERLETQKSVHESDEEPVVETLEVDVENAGSEQGGHALFDMNQDPFDGLTLLDPQYQNALNDAYAGFFEENISSWREPESEVECERGVTSTAAPKKVRFERTPSRSSSVSSEDEPEAVYPDLFALPADDVHVRTMVMHDDLPRPVDEESEYDFDLNNAGSSMVYEGENELDSDMSDSDFDSDLDDDETGNTTEEETEEMQLARMTAMRKAEGKGPATVSQSVPSTPVPAKRVPSTLADLTIIKSPGAVSNSKKKPPMGRFAHDPTKACVIAEPNGGGIKFIPPTKPPEKDREFWKRARQATSARKGTRRGSGSWTNSASPIPQLRRPLTANNTLGNNFGGNWGFLQDNDHANIATRSRGRVVADMVSMHVSFQSTSSAMSSTTLSASEDGENEKVEMEQLFHFDAISSESEMERPTSQSAVFSPAATEDSNEWNAESSPVVRQDSVGSSSVMQPYVPQASSVFSFRNNQHLARHVSSLPSNPAKRAELSEYNAMQKGRRSAGNTPITPARRQRVSQDLGFSPAGIRKTQGSPLVAKNRRSRGGSLSATLPAFGLSGYFASSSDQHEKRNE